jgi:hypothetical protein
MQNQKGYTLAGRSLFIALPAYDFKVSLKLAVSLARLTQVAPQHGIDIQIGSICGCSVVSRARNLLAQDFIDSNCTDLLFIDSDINFDPDDVFRLLAWASEPNRDIVAGVPRVRSTDPVYIAKLAYEEDNQITMNSMGLVKAERVATAFMMVKREVFTKLCELHPEWTYYDVRSERTVPALFDFKLTEEGYIGEDFLFCDRAREAGFEVWIDPTIKLGHMGVQEYMGDFGGDVLYPMVTSNNKQVA